MDPRRKSPGPTRSPGNEDGRREVNNRQTVAFDQNAVNPLDALVPKAGTLLAGRTLKGGLVYAGVNGAPEQQGNPKSIKPGPRVGATVSVGCGTGVGVAGAVSVTTSGVLSWALPKLSTARRRMR